MRSCASKYSQPGSAAPPALAWLCSSMSLSPRWRRSASDILPYWEGSAPDIGRSEHAGRKMYVASDMHASACLAAVRCPPSPGPVAPACSPCLQLVQGAPLLRRGGQALAHVTRYMGPAEIVRVRGALFLAVAPHGREARASRAAAAGNLQAAGAHPGHAGCVRSDQRGPRGLRPRRRWSEGGDGGDGGNSRHCAQLTGCSVLPSSA